MPIPSLTQWARLQELMDGRVLERLAALEAQLAKEGRRSEPFRPQSVKRAADAQRLRDAIRDLLERHPGPRRGAAKRISPHLLETDIGRVTQPSLRTVQWHIAQLRNAGHCVFSGSQTCQEL